MKMEEQIAMILEAILKCFDEDNDLSKSMNYSDIDENFFAAGVYALQVLFNKVTNSNERDVIDFIGVLNKIVVQEMLIRNGVDLEE